MKTFKNLMTLLLIFTPTLSSAFEIAQMNTESVDVLTPNRQKEMIEFNEVTTSNSPNELPWTRGIRDSGNSAHIYIPDNYDYHVIQELMSGSGFGPGNGGNELIFEVDSLVKKIIATISAHQDIFPEINISELQKEVETIGVFFLNKIPNNTNRVLTAANFPKERAILILKDKWRSSSFKEKAQLILHEYLGVMGIERENASISGRISPLMIASGQAKSFDPYNLGWLYSRTNTETFANKLVFSNDNTGVLINRSGEDKFSWKSVDNILFLKLSGQKTRVSFTTASHPSTGDLMQVETIFTPLEVEIRKLDSGFFEMKETTKVCKTFYRSSTNSQDLEVCEFQSGTVEQLIGTKDLKAKTIRLYENDYIALPVFSSGDFSSTQLIELKEGGSVHHIEGHGKSKITKWNLTGKKLSYQTEDGNDYSLRVIKRQNGIDRAIVVSNISGQKSVTIEPVTIVKEGELPEMTRNQSVGDFLPIYAGAGHTAEDWEPYVFDRDGLGGFETSMGPEESFMNHWSWSFKGDRINAKRYYVGDISQSNLSLAQTREEVEACANRTMPCEIQNDRDYIVLKKNGNRYTMLRLFRWYTPDNTDPMNPQMELRSEHSDLWVMDRL